MPVVVDFDHPGVISSGKSLEQWNFEATIIISQHQICIYYIILGCIYYIILSLHLLYNTQLASIILLYVPSIIL